jgi:hypothetical protein
MFNRKDDFSLIITKSCYYQNGKEYLTNIPYLHYKKDGVLTLNGADDIGEFNFQGYEKDGYFYLEKQYTGKHKIFYTGKLEENNLKLYYNPYCIQDSEDGILNLDNGVFNALIVFDENHFRLMQDDQED